MRLAVCRPAFLPFDLPSGSADYITHSVCGPRVATMSCTLEVEQPSKWAYGGTFKLLEVTVCTTCYPNDEYAQNNSLSRKVK